MNEIKNKADELVNRFIKHAYGRTGSPQSFREAKQCVLFLCREMEGFINKMPSQFSTRHFRKQELEDWQSIKQHIENNY